MTSKSALGKGLASLIPPKKQRKELLLDETKEHIVQLKTSEIKSNPFQPRDHINHQDLEDLICSIKEHGILSPLIVSRTESGYELIAGERRLKAAQILNFKTVPAIIRDASTQEKLELALVENLQRSNLNPIEEAKAYKRLMDEFNLTQEEVAKRVGKNRATVANSIRLLSLPSGIQESLSKGEITGGHAKVLLSLESEKDQKKLWKKMVKNKLTVRAGERLSRRKKAKAGGPRAVDSQIIVFEDSMRDRLETKVNIEKRGERGKIVIEFYSVGELRDIVDKILGKV